MSDRILELKSVVRKILGIKDPWRDFRRMLRTIHPGTWEEQPRIVDWLSRVQAEKVNRECEKAFLEAEDPVVRRGYELRESAKKRFHQAHAADTQVRILFYVPDNSMSSAGYSLFRNLAQGFEFMGISAALWLQGESITEHLHSFRPTIILADDREPYSPETYLAYADWEAIRRYRLHAALRIGLVASPYSENPIGLSRRLEHARRLGIDFFYSFQAPSFIDLRHAEFRRHGFPVCSLEFGANPLVYYPVPGIARDLNYFFLGSAHFEKWERYWQYFQRILAAHPGLLVGPGWPKGLIQSLPIEDHRYLYARARVGLNLHVPFQIDAACELNERAYNLAACGVPQLVDNPKLLPERFRSESVFAANSPTEYERLFFRILDRPDDARERALSALEDVYAGHTVFHRAESFLNQLDAHRDLLNA